MNLRTKKTFWPKGIQNVFGYLTSPCPTRPCRVHSRSFGRGKRERIFCFGFSIKLTTRIHWKEKIIARSKPFHEFNL